MQCQYPVSIPKEPYLVPCGKCPVCRSKHLHGWLLRALIEAEGAASVMFLTLTYSDPALPLLDSRGNIHTLSDGSFFIPRPPTGSLYPRHVTLFFKHLRTLKADHHFRYMCIGEYGETTFRPHYHVILFCDTPRPDCYFCEDYLGPECTSCSRCYFSAVRRAWPHGFVKGSSLTPGRLRYVVVQHCMPGPTPLGAIPSFSRTSRRPGIGDTELLASTFADNVRDFNLLTYEHPIHGRFGLPRFFREKVFTHPEICSANLTYDYTIAGAAESLAFNYEYTKHAYNSKYYDPRNP